MTLRSLAAKHLLTAQEQLSTGDQSSLRYACLDLRMAIECLTYDLLLLYKDDVLDETLKEWRADKILSSLKRIDPHADAGPKLYIANQEGSFEGADAITFEEHRFTAKWAIKAYHTLGRYLHERTFLEIENGRVDDWVKVRERAEEIAAKLQLVMNSTGWGLRIRRRLTVPCECGHDADFSMGPMQVRSRARCANCGADYEVSKDEQHANTVLMRRL